MGQDLLAASYSYSLHQSYYSDSAVEERLFKVPKYHLVRNSDHFSSLCSLAETCPGNDPDASILSLPDSETSAQNAIALPGVTADDFSNFLEALYPRTIQRVLTLTKEQWLSVLKLSTLWYFKELRRLAIDHLEAWSPSLTSIELIQLGKEYAISNWLLRGYHALVNQNGVISLESAKAIGMESAIRLYTLRSRTEWVCRNEDYLEQEFAEELGGVHEQERRHYDERGWLAPQQGRVEERAKLKTEQDERKKIRTEQKRCSDQEKAKKLAVAKEEREKLEAQCKALARRLESEVESRLAAEVKLERETQRASEYKAQYQALKKTLRSEQASNAAKISQGKDAIDKATRERDSYKRRCDELSKQKVVHTQPYYYIPPHFRTSHHTSGSQPLAPQ
ncbi:hypothetical protein CC1G_04680 [Coprinopsis cinerea okayama7|uniref:BTB domain-containing protein n=1 Tax=Coprinopsis cinerea (strain Okayama-7 / 130 / ATCC MYA-4618 / FGSC 9003) TaxID=240176 RepID=A8N4Y0_COPC7|nr:hypothetical protein CC1G_04680 [Coprinopsis cinerea okayama7\|eukprot:XP_001829991.2 hypothetical protein CC1G_04680 [Coprinopsis cinerea okayama7\